MRYVKPRKPRGIKLNGQPSQDLCPYCYSFGCDPCAMSLKFQSKIETRLRNGQCPACGSPINACKCKSSSKLKGGENLFILHNNKHRRGS